MSGGALGPSNGSPIEACVLCGRKLKGKTFRGAVIDRTGVAFFEMHRRCRRELAVSKEKMDAVMREGRNVLLLSGPVAGHA